MAIEIKDSPAVPAWSDGLETIMMILVIDIGGTNVKMLASGQDTPRNSRPARN